MSTWSPLQSRTLKLADWSAQLALSRVDPYLVWADATEFVGFVGGVPHNVQVAFEMIPTLCPPRPFKLCGGQAVPISPRFGVASVPLAGLKCLLSPWRQRRFPRFEVGLPLAGDPRFYATSLLGQGLDVFQPMAQAGASPVAPAVTPTPVAAVIDYGCPFAHQSFRTRNDDGKWQTRLGALWFQEDRVSWGFDKNTLNDWLVDRTRADGSVDEGACYRDQRDEFTERLKAGGIAPDAAELWWQRISAPASHGAHVLDVMAGSPNPLAIRHGLGTATDAAASAPLMFVQLPRQTVDDTSGLSMNVCVLEALAYIGRRTTGRPVLANLSYGSLAGPHDGSSLIECAIDDFLRNNSRFQVVLPAGNGYDSQTHASATIAPDGQWIEIRLLLLPGDPTDTFVEVWYAPTPHRPTMIDIALVAPDGTESDAVGCDSAFESIRDGATLPSMAIVHQSKPPVSANSERRCALVALAATRSRDPARPVAPHGIWKLRVRNRGPIAVKVDAWIERDDSAMGSGRSRSQANFLSDGTPPARGVAHGATAPIDRRSCLNSLAHGELPTVVGGYVLSTMKLVPYSASGPGRLGRRPGPNFAAPCESRPGVGLRAAGTRSGSAVEMNGTSVASAVAARALYNCAADSSQCPELTSPEKPDYISDPTHPLPHLALRNGDGHLKLP